MGTSSVGPVVSEFTITIEQNRDFEFTVRFDKPQYPAWLLDEPAPVGRDSGPGAARALAAAIGNCLSASLLFCARKSRIELGPIRTRVRTEIGRNESGRLRIGKVNVEIDPGMTDLKSTRTLRCLNLFEDYCVVTQSVRAGIDIAVSIVGADSMERPASPE